MAKDKGWFRIDRARWESEILKDNAERYAWVDLLSMLNYQEKELFLKNTGKTITVKVGETFTSMRHLSDRWMMQKSRVDRLIQRLERVGWIYTERDKSGTLIGLINTDNTEVVQTTHRDTKRTTNRDTDQSTDQTTERDTNRDRLKNKEYKNIKTGKEQKKGAQRRLNLWEGAPEE